MHEEGSDFGELIEEQKLACAALIQVANSYCQQGESGKLDLRAGANAFLTIKRLNRLIFTSLEKKRKDTECRKEKVEKLNLALENLLYKQAHVKREIRLCKDLSTPTLGSVEKELNVQIGTTEYSADLNSIHETAIDLMDNEIALRNEMQTTLQALTQKNQQLVDRLDKKRKFIDELPTRVSLVKAASSDLQNQFSSVLQDASSS